MHTKFYPVMACVIVVGVFSGQRYTHAGSDAKRTLLVTVFKDKIYSDDPRAKRLFDEIVLVAHREYAERKELKPTREELGEIFKQVIKQHPELVAGDEAKKKTAMRLFWLTGSSIDWVRAKALYEEYGGTIAVSSFGACTSITGRDAIVRKYVAAGEIQFHDATAKNAFWKRLKSPRVLDVTISDAATIERRFATSPWQRWIDELNRPAEDAAVEKSRKQ